MAQILPKIIHAAKIFVQDAAGVNTLFLKELEPFRYVWFWEKEKGIEIETPIWGGTAEEAIMAARQAWKQEGFTLFNCGFRYTLPERDEVGTNALFHQMAASYESMNGVYFDEEVGSNCVVQNASLEARLLFKNRT